MGTAIRCLLLGHTCDQLGQTRPVKVPQTTVSAGTQSPGAMYTVGEPQAIGTNTASSRSWGASGNRLVASPAGALSLSRPSSMFALRRTLTALRQPDNRYLQHGQADADAASNKNMTTGRS